MKNHYSQRCFAYSVQGRTPRFWSQLGALSQAEDIVGRGVWLVWRLSNHAMMEASLHELDETGHLVQGRRASSCCLSAGISVVKAVPFRTLACELVV